MRNYVKPLPGSFLLPLLWHVLNFLYKRSLFSLIICVVESIGRRCSKWLARLLSCNGNRERLTVGLLEAYVLLWALLMAALLVCEARSAIIVALATYRLADIAVVTLHSVFAEPQVKSDENGYPAVHVKHPSRWIALSAIQVFEIVVNFAIIRLFLSTMGTVKAGRAFYDSLCLTLFSPFPPGHSKECEAHGLPMYMQTIHLLYSLLFFLVVLPVAISSIRTVLASSRAHGTGGSSA